MMLRRLGVVVICGVLLLLSVLASKAQEHSHHNHPPQDAAVHEQFYSDWMRPDYPSSSCCNKEDCYPTEARFVDGQLQMKRREDGRWLHIPATKIEWNRDSPDGRNHMCAAKPAEDPAEEMELVFCAILGSSG